jgi:hypothetical protein
MRIRLYSLTFILFFPLIVWSQAFVKGHLKDKNNTPVEYATVQLIQQQLSFEVQSDHNGYFQINVPVSEYQLLITHIGKILLDTIISVNSSIDIDLTLAISGETLQSVNVVAQKNWLLNEPDKISVILENTPFKKGFSAKEAIQLLPGILIQDNSIFKFGIGEIMIAVNGKLSRLRGTELLDFLKNIPSELVEKVEYHYNTGAVNDAAGAGVMVNIVYKKEVKAVTNSNAYLEHDQNKYAIQRMGAYYSLKSSRLETYLSLTGRRGYEEVREKRTLDNHQYSWKGEDFTKRQANPFSLNYYLYYQLTKKTAAGGQFFWNIYDAPNSTDGNYHYQNLSNADYNYKARGNREGKLKSYSLFLNQQIGNKLRMEIDWDYVFSAQEDDRLVQTFKTSSTNDIRSTNKFTYNNYSVNWRFNYDIKTLHLSWGAKYNLNRTGNDLFTFNQNAGLNLGQLYYVKEEISAAFADATYTKSFWNARAGLRLEHTDFSTHNNLSSDQYAYKFTRLFPSFSIGRPVGKSSDIRFRYNYSLQRPKFSDVTPFRKYYDDNAYSVGNPYLSPQFKHYFEIGYNTKNNLSFNLYYALTKNGQAIVYFLDTLTNLQVSQPQNFFTLHNTGLSVSKLHRFTSRWSLIHMAYVYYNSSRFHNDYSKIAEPFNGWAVYYNAQLQYNHKNTYINVSGHVDPPKKAIYFQAKGSYALNVELDQRFNKIPMKLNLQVKDIFNTRPAIHQFSVNNTEQSYFINESSRRVVLRLTYFFRQNHVNRRNYQSEYNKESDRYNL